MAGLAGLVLAATTAWWLVAVGLVAVNYLNPMRWLRVPTEFGTLVISGSKITMEAPRLAGFTKDQREYEVSATAVLIPPFRMNQSTSPSCTTR